MSEFEFGIRRCSGAATMAPATNQPCRRGEQTAMRPSRTPERSWRLLWHYASTDRVPDRSLKVALIVGIALNLINQGEALFGAASVNWLKLALTFAMPYVVSTYGAVAVRWEAAADQMSDSKNSN